MKEQIKTIGNYEAKTYGWALQERLIILSSYFKAIGNTKGKSVLDLGCGYGWITKMLSSKCKKAVGIDISNQMIEIAKKRFNADNINYITLSGEEISKLKEHFDVIVSSLMLHASTSHKNMIKTLMGCFSILKDDGNMIILVPHPCFSNLNKREYNTYTFSKEFNYFKPNQEYKVRLKSEKGVTEFINKFYNLTDYFSAFKEAGFVVEEIVEPEVSEYAKKKHHSLWNSELKTPFYIIFRLKKK